MSSFDEDNKDNKDSENYKAYQFVYSDFDQLITEVIEFDESMTSFLENNPDFDYDSCISLDLEETSSLLPQLYSFNVVIWKKDEK